MLQTFRRLLPQALIVLGLATIGLSIVLAVLAFTTNPLVVVTTLVGGTGFGLFLAGMGVIVENSISMERNVANARAAVQAQTKALQQVSR